ncbi:MAG: transglycosylase SLT domain-containing protein [Bacteroidota bacterium]
MTLQCLKPYFPLLVMALLSFNGYAQNKLQAVAEFIPEVEYNLVEDRLSCVEKDIPLNFNNRVQAFVEYFTIRDRAYTRNILRKKELYFPLFERKLKEHGLPDELKYLSIIESALNPNAISRVGAVGLWQFMPYTGRSFGLHQDWYIDERIDPEASTEAACRYMKQLYRMFGDWELALASYNAGPGNVRRAIRRSGYKKSFWEIYRYLPRETRSYVPQFVAIIYALEYADKHNIETDSREFLPASDTIMVSQYFHLETFCKQLDLCYEDIAQLNPHIKRGALPEKIKNFPLRIPADLKSYIVLNRATLYDTASKVGKKHLEMLARNTPGSTYGRQRLIHRVRSGEVLGKIALSYNVRVADLRKWNRIRGNLIRVGQKLNIWVLPSYSSKTKDLYASNASPKKPKSKSVKEKTKETVVKEVVNGRYYQVKNGDTLWDISKMYDNLSIEKLKKLNNLDDNKIKPGQKLLIGVD